VDPSDSSYTAVKTLFTRFATKPELLHGGSQCLDHDLADLTFTIPDGLLDDGLLVLDLVPQLGSCSSRFLDATITNHNLKRRHVFAGNRTDLLDTMCTGAIVLAFCGHPFQISTGPRTVVDIDPVETKGRAKYPQKLHFTGGSRRLRVVGVGCA
jgi:hypothetical protein